MKKLLAALVIGIASMLCAQSGLPTNQSSGPPPDAYANLLFYDGSNNVIFSCKALGQQPSFTWTRAASTLTSIAVLTNTGTVTTSTAHGLAVNNPVTVSGATVDTDLNGTFVVQTVGSSTTYTITTASVGNATYTESTLQVATTAPRTTAPIWDIIQYTISGSNVAAVQHAGGKSAPNSICANRAVTTGSTKIAYQ